MPSRLRYCGMRSSRIASCAATSQRLMNIDATDSTTGLQAPGAIGVVPYLSASATNAPITLSFDGLVATAP